MDDRHGWRIVAALAVSQTVGFGVQVYAFAVLLQPMAQTLDASTTAITGAVTASMLAGAAAAVPVGRWLDRRGGRALMTLGSLLATAFVVAWSQVTSVVALYAVLVGLGLTGAMSLYQPAFAVIVSWFDAGRRGTALLAVTVVAGFASSIFFPLTGALVDAYGWRTALLVLAAIHGVLTVPLHALALRAAPHLTAQVNAAQVNAAQGTSNARLVIRDLRFWVLAIALVAHGAAVNTIAIHLVSYLTTRGHPLAFASTVAGLIGVLSVTGRVVFTGFQRRARTTTVVAVVFAIQTAAALSLPLLGADRLGAAVGVIGFGLGFGVATLAGPALLTERYGTADYATIAGIVAVPTTLAKAGAPLGAAVLQEASGYTPVLLAVAGACAIAAAGVALHGVRARVVSEPKRRS
jgi:MFS family permease